MPSQSGIIGAQVSKQQWLPCLAMLNKLAQQGKFSELVENCRDFQNAYSDNVDILLDIGAILLQAGLLSLGRACFERVRSLAPSDLRPVVNLANVARESGHHAEANRLYATLVAQLPHAPLVQRNALVSQEYDPAVSDAHRLAQARAWGAGRWIEQADHSLGRPCRPCRDVPCGSATCPRTSASTPWDSSSRTCWRHTIPRR